MVKKKYKNALLSSSNLFNYGGGATSVGSNYSSLGNQYRAQGLFPEGTNNVADWKPTANPSTTTTTGGKGNKGGGASGSGNALGTIGQIGGFIGMFDSLAQMGTNAIDSGRSGTANQPGVLVEGVLGGQTGTHLQNMWNTGEKTAAALDYINKQRNIAFDSTSSENLLAEHDAIAPMETLNINTRGKELEDFIFDPASYLITRLTGRRETAAERQRRINEAILANNAAQNVAYANAVNTFQRRQARNVAANYAAFGGPIFGYVSDGALGYDLAKDKLNLAMMKAMGNQNSGSAVQSFDKGGPIFNYDLGISLINAGGSHEENPLGGVPMGIAPDGKPNVVEEGESVYKDYVFSKRLPVPKAIRNKYKMRSTNFSDLFKEYLEKNGIDERENDPIAQNGLLAFASDLMVSQEMVRAKRNKNEDSRMAAYGGHLFDDGSKIIYDRSKTKDNYFNDLYAEGSDYMTALNWLNDPANVRDRDALIADINAGKYDTETEKINGVVVTPDTWYGLATDGLKGPVHNAIIKNMAAIKAKLAAPAPATTSTVAPTANPDVTYQNVSIGLPEDDGLIRLPDGRVFTPEQYESVFGEPAPSVSQDGSWTPEGIARAVGAIPLEDGTYMVPVPNGAPASSAAPATTTTTAENTTADPTTGNGAASVTSPYSELGNRARMAGLFANMGALAYNIFDPYRPRVLDEIGDFAAIHGTPIGNYAPDFHTDTRYNSNRLAQQAAATKAAILNTTAPNRYANLMNTDYNAQTAQGDMLIKDAAAEFDNLLKSRGFNRETDKYNSQLALDVAKANMSGRQAHKSAKLQQEQYNVGNYDSFKRGKDAAIGQGISNIVDWINANNREKDNLAMLAALRDSGALASNDAMDLLYNYLAGVRPTKTRSKKSKNNGEG